MLAVGLAAPAVVARPATAAASQQPCWRDVIEDWTNGGIQHRYAVHCYSAALSHLPTDVRLYSDAADDIHRALLAALRRDDSQGGGGPRAGGGQAVRETTIRNRAIVLLVTATVIA